MGIDIGGTNTNIGVAGIQENKPELLFSLEFNSSELDSITPVIVEALKYSQEKYLIEITSACIGAAGVVSQKEGSVELTNVSWNVSLEKILQNTSLKKVLILNDFQLIGYGLNIIKDGDLHIIRSVKNPEIKLTKAIIGAGTGLGKATVIYNEQLQAYIPIPSEGGHGDFPIISVEDQQLANFIKEKQGIQQPLTYEEVLSGRGLENIYLFLKEKNPNLDSNYTNEIDASSEKANLISKYKNVDEVCKETFKIFTRYYGRCAKNFVLDTMATGGLYIAGGIASKNKEIFTSNDFISEFENAYRRSDVLENTPIFLIENYDVSLYGACFAAMCHL